MKTSLTIDFETQAIRGNPTAWPPEPVGMAYKWSGQPGKYVGWGHPTGNNASGPDKAKRIVAGALADDVPLVFQNAKFDTSIIQYLWGMDLPVPTRVHDTLYQIFLADPYASSFSLKPSAERILDWPPDEQDKLKEWILDHIDCKPTEWGAHIADAPGSLVADYAIGDVDRTEALFLHLRKDTPTEAYEREQLLMPIMQESERNGIRVNADKFDADLEMYEAALLRCEDWLRRTLKNDHIEFSKGAQVADALEKAGKIGQWVLTPTGKRSTSKENLEAAVNSPLVLKYMQYRNALAHCLQNFMRPWRIQRVSGRLHPEWNQVRQAKTDRDPKGARTGRLSSGRPNFMNVPNPYENPIPKTYPSLPVMREYLLPEPGHVWCKRDYSQQELRIMAHYSEGRLYQRYQENPKVDAHDETMDLVKQHTGKEFLRKSIKITGFSVIYGSGVRGLSHQLGVGYPEAQEVRDAYFAALPEVPILMDACQGRGRAGTGIRTWGGRHYLSEPSHDGRDFHYKLLNYLIQGSAADCTKEAIIRWNEDKGRGQFLCTVHDEINISAPKASWKQDMKRLTTAMESIEFEVKMLSDGSVGKSWAKLEDCA